jgi:hypothetical protein
MRRIPINPSICTAVICFLSLQFNCSILARITGKANIGLASGTKAEI